MKLSYNGFLIPIDLWKKWLQCVNFDQYIYMKINKQIKWTQSILELVSVLMQELRYQLFSKFIWISIHQMILNSSSHGDSDIPFTNIYLETISRLISKAVPIEMLDIYAPSHIDGLMQDCRISIANALEILGAVSIRKTVLPGMAIPMLKIRRPNGRLIFNMEITIRR